MSKTYITRLHGVTRKNPDGASRQYLIGKLCYPGLPVDLVRTPTEQDPSEISVLVTDPSTGNRHFIGALEHDDATAIVPHLDRGAKFTAVVDRVSGGYGQKRSRGVNLEITLYEDTETIPVLDHVAVHITSDQPITITPQVMEEGFPASTPQKSERSCIRAILLLLAGAVIITIIISLSVR